jgi:cell division protein FtsB
MDRIKNLEDENIRLKVENEKLKLEIKTLRENDWKHPDSCLHNCDPWATWK